MQEAGTVLGNIRGAALCKMRKVVVSGQTDTDGNLTVPYCVSSSCKPVNETAQTVYHPVRLIWNEDGQFPVLPSLFPHGGFYPTV